jgi:hypothetical protein
VSLLDVPGNPAQNREAPAVRMSGGLAGDGFVGASVANRWQSQQEDE